MRRFSLLFLLAFTAACSTTRGRADDAYDKGDYMRAAELYEQVVSAHPKDAEARDRLATARGRAIEALLVRAEERVRMKDASGGLTAVGALLEVRERWDAPSSPRINEVAKWAREVVKDEISRTRDQQGAFAAEARLTARTALLRRRELGDAMQEMTATVKSAGDANCAALSAYASPQSPYLTELVASYCRHFAAPVPPPAPLPDLVSSLEIRGNVEGIDGATRQRLADTIHGWLKGSIWYAAEPVRVGYVTMSGTIRSTFAATPVTRSVDWVESVPYTDTESYQEPYEESYLDTDYYTESEPYSDTEYYTTTCGYGSSAHSCSQSRTVTKYRSVQKSRLVTKHRTRYRTAYRTVTRYRNVDRTYTYEAIARTGAYRSDWSMQVAFGGAEPFIVHRANATQRQGDDHDAIFPNANVRPSRANLLTHEGWVSTQIADLGAAYMSAANEHWARLYCARPTFSNEEAARCVYLRQRSYPEPARAALTQMLGRELDNLLAAEQ